MSDISLIFYSTFVFSYYTGSSRKGCTVCHPKDFKVWEKEDNITERVFVMVVCLVVSYVPCLIDMESGI